MWGSAAAHRDWMRPWIAADAGSPTAPSPGGRRTFAVVDYGHPGANRASANIGDHVQSIASLGHLVRHRGVRLHGREDLVGLLAAARRPHAPRAAPRRRRRGPRGDDHPPRRVDVRGDPGGHLGPVLRLVHARAVQHAPRLPAAPQPAADLHLVPLQQARAADARRGRVPQALRPGRLPRLDDGLPAAVARRAGVLLGLPDHDDQRRVPGPRRGPARRRAGRLRRRGARGRARRRRDVQAQLRRGPAALVRRERLRRGRPAGDLPRQALGRRHLAAALLPAGALARREGRLPAQEPVRRPLRRAARHRRQGVRTRSATASPTSSSRSSPRS